MNLAGKRPRSMTARLITLQVLAVAALLGGAMVALYYSISAHLEEDNREELANQSAVLARWLADTENRAPSDPHIRHTRAELVATLPVFLRLLAADGRLLLESPQSPAPPRAAFPAPGQTAVAWLSPAKQRRLLSSSWLPAPPGQPGSLLQVAYDVSDDDTLLRHLRQRMGLVFSLAVVLSGLLTLLIARGVFRPLARLTAAAAAVHASQLNARIKEAGWPVELAALAREFDAMLVRLDESFRRLARFSSDLSHELRTPINNLRGEAEVALSRQRDPADYRRVLESGLEECARLGRLIDTLLFIAKADNPAEGIRRRTLDGAAECRAVAEFFEATAAERNLAILVRGGGPGPGQPGRQRRPQHRRRRPHRPDGPRTGGPRRRHRSPRQRPRHRRRTSAADLRAFLSRGKKPRPGARHQRLRARAGHSEINHGPARGHGGNCQHAGHRHHLHAVFPWAAARECDGNVIWVSAWGQCRHVRFVGCHPLRPLHPSPRRPVPAAGVTAGG